MDTPFSFLPPSAMQPVQIFMKDFAPCTDYDMVSHRVHDHIISSKPIASKGHFIYKTFRLNIVEK